MTNAYLLLKDGEPMKVFTDLHYALAAVSEGKRWIWAKDALYRANFSVKKVEMDTSQYDETR